MTLHTAHGSSVDAAWKQGCDGVWHLVIEWEGVCPLQTFTRRFKLRYCTAIHRQTSSTHQEGEMKREKE